MYCIMVLFHQTFIKMYTCNINMFKTHLLFVIFILQSLLGKLPLIGTFYTLLLLIIRNVGDKTFSKVKLYNNCGFNQIGIISDLYTLQIKKTKQYKTKKQLGSLIMYLVTSPLAPALVAISL